MPSTISCRLCMNVCSLHISLYDKNGCETTMYSITVKYFPTIMLDSVVECQHLSTICMKYWQHISDFHVFQQSVLQTQKLYNSGSMMNTTNPSKSVDISVISETKDKQLEGTVRDTIHIKCEKEDEVVLNANNDLKSNNDHIISHISSSDNELSKQCEDISIKCEKDEEFLYDQPETTKPIIDSVPPSCSPNQSKNSINTNILDDSDMTAANKTNICIKEEYVVNEPINNSSIGERISDEMDLSQAENASEKESSKREFNSHQHDVFIARWRPVLECYVCFNTFSKYSFLLQHFQQLHADEKCRLSCCDQNFYDQIEISQHITMYHKPEKKQFKCDKCSRLFNKRSNLKRHMVAIHNEKVEPKSRNVLKCSNCGKEFGGKSSLNRHMLLHCSLNQSKHSTNTSILDDSDMTAANSCYENETNICTKEEYVVNESINNSSIGERISDEMDLSQAENASEKESYMREFNSDQHDVFIARWRPVLECHVCFNTFSKYSCLLQHFQELHADEKCRLSCCDQNFYDQIEISKHITMYHKPEKKQFKCDKCSRLFNKRSNLKRHLVAIHNEKVEPKSRNVLKCSNCGKEFNGNTSLNRHMRLHCKAYQNYQMHKKRLEVETTKSDGFKCSNCGKSFCKKYSLKRHMQSSCKRNQNYKMSKIRREKAKAAKNSNGPKCLNCGKSFCKQFSLNRHMQSSCKKIQNHQVPMIKRKVTFKSNGPKCSICCKSFCKQYSLNRHMRLHCEESRNIELQQFVENSIPLENIEPSSEIVVLEIEKENNEIQLL